MNSRRLTTLLLGLGLLLPAGGAQVLARPGWAGSGVAPEPWWRRAVLYRVDPARFQDSRGYGRGDLKGLAGRLDYVQSLGVDALLLDGGNARVNSIDADGSGELGDLIHEASRHHLRLLLTVEPGMVEGSPETLLTTVRGWLGAGAAGVWVPKSNQAAALGNGSYPALVARLRSLVQSFPGDRVLLTDPDAVPVNLAPRPLRLRRGIDPSAFHAARGGQLVTAAALRLEPAEVEALGKLRASLAAVGQQGTDADPLLRFAQTPPPGSPLDVAAAALLLGSRGAAIVDFGDEIGLNLYPDKEQSSAFPVMQWTPSNHTPAAIERTAAAGGSGTPLGETEFGTYHPYVPPPRGLSGPMPTSPKVTVDGNLPAALPDPDSLPGFTTGRLPREPVRGAELNVVTEDRDPRSLLNVYRQLIGLHHDNATLRNGTQSMLNHDAEGVLVWVRRAPVGSRTVGNVLGAANLSDRPVTLTVDAELESTGMRPGALRPLFVSAPETMTGQTTERLFLPPYGVLVGEIFHASGRSAPRAERRSEPGAHRRRSRHRARR